MLVTTTVQRANSYIRQKCWNMLARNPTGNKSAKCPLALQVSLVYRVNNEQLFAQVSPLNIMPFQHLPLTLFRPFSTSLPCSSGVGGKDSLRKGDDLFDKVDTAAYKLLYAKIEDDDVITLSSLWKQAMEGPCKEPEPVDPRCDCDLAYWQGWKDLGNMSKEEAAQKYLQLAEKYM